MGGAGQGGKGKRPISVKFEIPYFTTSGIQVRYLKIIEPKVSADASPCPLPFLGFAWFKVRFARSHWLLFDLWAHLPCIGFPDVDQVLLTLSFGNGTLLVSARRSWWRRSGTKGPSILPPTFLASFRVYPMFHLTRWANASRNSSCNIRLFHGSDILLNLAILLCGFQTSNEPVVSCIVGAWRWVGLAECRPLCRSMTCSMGIGAYACIYHSCEAQNLLNAMKCEKKRSLNSMSS